MPHKAPGQSSEILVRAYQRIRTSCPSIADRWIVDADIVDVMVAAYPSLDDPDTPLLNSAKFNKAVTTHGNSILGPFLDLLPMNNPTGHYRLVHTVHSSNNGKRIAQRRMFYYYELNASPKIPGNNSAWQDLINQSAATAAKTISFLADPLNLAKFHRDNEIIINALKTMSKGEVAVLADSSAIEIACLSRLIFSNFPTRFV